MGDTAYFGPEPEFFIFDAVTWSVDMSGSFVRIKSEEAPWSTGIDYEAGNLAHRPPVKGGYFPVPPTDSLQDIRSEMCLLLEQQGVEVEVHHHEVAAPGQNEIGTKFSTLVKRADWMQIYYIGGIIKHAKALNAITNPGTNSYKRLVPGFEAPINLAYSARNRSAACRIPYVSNPKGRRVEVRFPDPTANSYLAFSAMLMAGLDGVENRIHPGEPMDKNLYDLEPEEAAKVPHPCASLEEALDNLDRDREFLTRGGVFSNDLIDAYIGLKMDEVTRFRMTTHPLEFDMYYGS